MTAHSTQRFGVFELDAQAGELRRAGVRIPLQDLPLRLLSTLIAQAGEVVSREDLRDTLWDQDVHVDFDTGLNTAVRRVRDALDDSATHPRFVETVPRRGYRFLASVEPNGETATVTTKEAPATKRSVLRAGLLTALLATGITGWLLGRAGVGWPNDASPRLSPHITTSKPMQAEARVELLRAQHFAERRTREGLERAIAACQSALASDPSSADAHSGIAMAYLLLGIYDYWRPAEVFEVARKMTERALALDEASAQAHLAAGLLAFFSDWQWDRAEHHLDRAVALDADLGEAHLMRGVLLTHLGQPERGLEATRKALALAPTSPVINTMLAWLFFFADRPEDALEQTRRTIELAPDHFDLWDNLKWMHIAWGNDAEASAAWRRAATIEDGDDHGLAEHLEARGLRGVIRSVTEKRLAQAAAGETEYRSPYDLAIELTAIGKTETALDWLDRSFTEHETDLLALGVDPRLDPLRDHPRFVAMLERMAFPAP